MNNNWIYQYSKLVRFLGATLGPDYEVALHDIASKHHHIVAIANGHVSGRSVGAPLTDSALRMMLEKAYENEDFKLNYKGISKGNKTLRSSTMFIKDETGKLVGMLCINFDPSRYTELSARVMALIQPQGDLSDFYALPLEPGEAPVIGNLYQTIEDAARLAMEEIHGGPGFSAENFSRREKQQIVEFLNKKGIFLLKGAVGQVAGLIGSSEATIYRYLSKLKQEPKE